MQSHAITYTCNVWPCGWSRVAHVCRWSRSVPQLWTTYRNASQTLKEVGKWAKMPLVSYRALAHWSRLDHMAACKGRDLHANSMIREPVETWHIFGYRQEVLKGKMEGGREIKTWSCLSRKKKSYIILESLSKRVQIDNISCKHPTWYRFSDSFCSKLVPQWKPHTWAKLWRLSLNLIVWRNMDLVTEHRDGCSADHPDDLRVMLHMLHWHNCTRHHKTTRLNMLNSNICWGSKGVRLMNWQTLVRICKHVASIPIKPRLSDTMFTPFAHCFHTFLLPVLCALHMMSSLILATTCRRYGAVVHRRRSPKSSKRNRKRFTMST